MIASGNSAVSGLRAHSQTCHLSSSEFRVAEGTPNAALGQSFRLNQTVHDRGLWAMVHQQRSSWIPHSRGQPLPGTGRKPRYGAGESSQVTLFHERMHEIKMWRLIPLKLFIPRVDPVHP